MIVCSISVLYFQTEKLADSRNFEGENQKKTEEKFKPENAEGKKGEKMYLF